MVKFLPNRDVSRAVMRVTKEIEVQSSAEEFPSSQLWCTAGFVVRLSIPNIFYHEIEIKEKRLNREIHCVWQRVMYHLLVSWEILLSF